jgi:CD2 antigen cytoplasmic tail-binding protein 2
MRVDKPSKPSDIEHITHLASQIMSLGDTDVYSKTYEELVRTVRASGSVDSNWVPPSSNKKYEYKWDAPTAEQSSETFGPFGEEEMRAWFKASYFGPTGEKVKVREVDHDWGDWDEIVPP